MSDDISFQSAPNSIEAEKNILGVILSPLICKDVKKRIYQQLIPEDFYNSRNRKISETAWRLFSINDQIDITIIGEELKKQKILDDVGGQYYLVGLVDLVVSSENVPRYLLLIQEASQRRKIIQICEKAKDTRYELTEIYENVEKIIKPRSQSVLPSRMLLSEVLHDLETTEDQGWWIDRLIPKNSLVMISAPTKSYKSTLAYCMAAAITSGRDFSTKNVEPTKVLYIDKENSIGVQKERIPKIFGGNESRLMSVWGTMNPIQPPLLTSRDFNLYLELSREFSVIIFDTLRRFHQSEENSSTEMEQIMSKLLMLRDLGKTIIFLHHSGKSDFQKYRGSEEILAATDLSYTVKREHDIIKLEQMKNRYREEEKIEMKVIWNEQIRIEIVSEALAEKTTEHMTQIMKIVRLNHDETGKWPNQSTIISKGRELGLPKNEIPKLLSECQKDGQLDIVIGPQGSKIYHIPISQDPSLISDKETGKAKEGPF